MAMMKENQNLKIISILAKSNNNNNSKMENFSHLERILNICLFVCLFLLLFNNGIILLIDFWVFKMQTNSGEKMKINLVVWINLTTTKQQQQKIHFEIIDRLRFYWSSLIFDSLHSKNLSSIFEEIYSFELQKKSLFKWIWNNRQS